MQTCFETDVGLQSRVESAAADSQQLAEELNRYMDELQESERNKKDIIHTHKEAFAKKCRVRSDELNVAAVDAAASGAGASGAAASGAAGAKSSPPDQILELLSVRVFSIVDTAFVNDLFDFVFVRV